MLRRYLTSAFAGKRVVRLFSSEAEARVLVVSGKYPTGVDQDKEPEPEPLPWEDDKADDHSFAFDDSHSSQESAAADDSFSEINDIDVIDADFRSTDIANGPRKPRANTKKQHGRLDNISDVNSQMKFFSEKSNKHSAEKVFQLYHNILAKGLVPTMDTFEYMLTALPRLMNRSVVKTGMGIMKDMVRSGFEVTPEVYSKILVACAERRQDDAAMQIYEYLKNSNGELPAPAANAVLKIRLNRVDGNPSSSDCIDELLSLYSLSASGGFFERTVTNRLLRHVSESCNGDASAPYKHLLQLEKVAKATKRAKDRKDLEDMMERVQEEEGIEAARTLAKSVFSGAR